MRTMPKAVSTGLGSGPTVTGELLVTLARDGTYTFVGEIGLANQIQHALGMGGGDILVVDAAVHHRHRNTLARNRRPAHTAAV